MRTQRWMLSILVTSLVTSGFGCQAAIYFDRSLIPNDAGVDAGDGSTDSDGAADSGDPETGSADDAAASGDASRDASDQ